MYSVCCLSEGRTCTVCAVCLRAGHVHSSVCAVCLGVGHVQCVLSGG